MRFHRIHVISNPRLVQENKSQLETKAKEVREWCDAVGLTATKVDYQKKRVELEELMAALGL